MPEKPAASSQRIVIKLKPGVPLAPLGSLVKGFPQLTFKPVCTRPKLIKRQFPYLVAIGPTASDLEPIAVKLRKHPDVSTAYVERPVPAWSTGPPRPDDSPPVSNDRNPNAVFQDYLDPAPVGIDVQGAWAELGGKGSGVRIVDVEMGWTLNHQDLVERDITQLEGSFNDSGRGHGTCVLGVICAVDNPVGCIGIAPELDRVLVVPCDGYPSDFADAILYAATTLRPGDVLLVPMQNADSLPLEVELVCFEAIQMVVAAGIVVVEPAGNGQTELNALPGLKDDSGAILVGAGTKSVPHQRANMSNWGARVDCYAWGEEVYAPTSNEYGVIDQYTKWFDGTSSAASIVAGVAICVQGMARSKYPLAYTPQELRDILRRTGTPASSPAEGIGLMPDLKAIAQVVQMTPPAGTPHPVPLSDLAAAPD